MRYCKHSGSAKPCDAYRRYSRAGSDLTLARRVGDGTDVGDRRERRPTSARVWTSVNEATETSSLSSTGSRRNDKRAIVVSSSSADAYVSRTRDELERNPKLWRDCRIAALAG